MQRIAAHRACGLLYRFVRQYKGVYLLPANVCPVVPLTLCSAGVPFEFVDINPTTLCIDESTCLEKLKGQSYAGIIFVRTYGYIYDANSFIDAVHEYGKKVIDDRCLCIPDLNLVSAAADMVLYSTGYAKCVDIGGGAFAYLDENIQLSSEDLAYGGVDIENVYKPLLSSRKKVSILPHGWLDIELGQSDIYFDTISRELPLALLHKNQINQIYKSILPKYICMDDTWQNWRFNIRVDDKEKLLKLIFDQGCFASSHYQPSSILFTETSYLNADCLFNQVVNLFNDKYISEDHAIKIAEIIKAQYE